MEPSENKSHGQNKLESDVEHIRGLIDVAVIGLAIGAAIGVAYLVCAVVEQLIL